MKLFPDDHEAIAGTARRLRQGKVTCVDALVTPATLGAAPDPSTTGDPVFNSPWSLLGLPTVSFPIGLSADGLPLAVQRSGEHDSTCIS